MRMASNALVAATYAAPGFAAAAPALADEAAPPSDITVTGAATLASQYRFCGLAQSDNKLLVQGTFTSTHRSNLYVYGAGFDLPKPFSDYNVGITAKYRNLAFDASVVGTKMSRSDFAWSGLCSFACGEALTAVDTGSNSYDRTAKPVGVIPLTAPFRGRAGSPPRGGADCRATAVMDQRR
jgi:Bacterial protein of unknown function (Gcw_chp)